MNVPSRFCHCDIMSSCLHTSYYPANTLNVDFFFISLYSFLEDTSSHSLGTEYIFSIMQFHVDLMEFKYKIMNHKT